MKKAAILMSFALAACASPDIEELPASDGYTPSNKTTGKSSPAASGSAASSDAPVPTTDPTTPKTSRRWHGTLATTEPLTFGGTAGFCTYRITLKEIAVDVLADETDTVVFASAEALAVENTITSNCNAPTPPNTHHYALTTAAKLGAGVTHLELTAASTNNPIAALVIEGNFGSPSPVLSLRWHRTDQSPPLDWTVSAQVPVSPQ